MPRSNADGLVILVEVTAAIDQFGTLRTFYLSDAAFTTGPTEIPANTSFEPAISNAGDVGVYAFGDGRTTGASRLEVGEITLVNADGRFDAWSAYGFDGRDVVIRAGLAGGLYPNAFPAVLAGTIDGPPEVGFSKITLRVRDRQLIFDQPAQTSTYAGTNSLPNGVDGVAGDLKGKRKPKVFGAVANVSPPCVNTSKLIFQLNDGPLQAVGAVYDRGVALTFGTDRANNADMQATAPGAGGYDTCRAEGLIRLGSSPAGQITADATQGAASSDRTAAQMLKGLALLAGVGASEIAPADVASLDTANASVLGLWLNNDETIGQAMDMVAASVGAYYAFDPNGVFRMGRIAAPTAAVGTIQDYDTLSGTERRQARDTAIPVWRVTVGHTRFWTTQPTDLAGSVTTARRAELAQEYRTEKAEDASIKVQFLLSGEMRIDTLLTVAADAAAEASRLLALHKVRRDTYEVPIPLSAFSTLAASGLRIGKTVTFTLDRFGLSSGKLFLLTGYRLELARRRVTLLLWG